MREEFDRSYKQADRCEDSDTIEPTQVHQLVPYSSLSCLLQTPFLQKPQNVFDDLPSLRPSTEHEHHDELACYLQTDPQVVEDVFLWWQEHSLIYPRLLQMAFDYLTIPGPSCFKLPFMLHEQITYVACSDIGRCQTCFQLQMPRFVSRLKPSLCTVYVGIDMPRILEFGGYGARF